MHENSKGYGETDQYWHDRVKTWGSRGLANETPHGGRAVCRLWGAGCANDV